MNASKVIKDQTTLSPSQWQEIQKFVTLSKIKNAIADLFEMAPELEMDSTMDFIHGLVLREMKSRKK